jgi:hypothetical protein
MRMIRLPLLILGLAVEIILPAEAQTNFKQNCITNGANNANVVVDQTLSPSLDGNESLAAGDTLVAYTDDGRCAGYEVWTGNDDVSFSVAGPNAATDDPDRQGYASDETLKLKIFDASEDQYTDYESNISFTPCSEVGVGLCENEGTYTPDVVYVVEGLSSSALPVELTAFEALRSGENVTLGWRTASETNNSGFEVQHRRDGESWSTLTFVEGAGTTTNPQSYRYQTDELKYGTHKFRLTQVDRDGSQSKSETVNVQFSLISAYEISKVSPHPVQRTASLDLTVKNKQRVTVRVYDLLGREQGVLLSKTLPADQTESLRLDASRLPSGQYFLRIEGESFRETRRMTVVK